MKILIIDDDAALRYMLSEILSFAGWESAAASNGREGIAAFQNGGADIILVDYHMPELDGLETVKLLRKLDPVVPILVLTVDERQEIADRFLDEGATDFALKPVKAPDLISRIQLHSRLREMLKQAEQREEEVFVTKGISRSTLSLIEGYFREHPEPATVEEISQGLGLAVPTVYRYLTYLLQKEQIRTLQSYQKTGRPKNRYEWSGTAGKI